MLTPISSISVASWQQLRHQGQIGSPSFQRMAARGDRSAGVGRLAEIGQVGDRNVDGTRPVLGQVQGPSRLPFGAV